MKSKTLGFIILAITLLGLAGSTASMLISHASQGAWFFAPNYFGDILTLIGGILLVMKNIKGRPFVYAGSVLFGLAGIISMSYSVIGGMVTLLIAAIFILLTKSARF